MARQTSQLRIPIRLLILLAMIFPPGCSQDERARLDRVEQSLSSWTATLQAAADQWAHHRVTPTYVRQVVQAAGEALDEQEKSLKKISQEKGRAAELESQLQQLRQRAGELKSAVDQNDPARAAGLFKPPE